MFSRGILILFAFLLVSSCSSGKVLRILDDENNVIESYNIKSYKMDPLTKKTEFRTQKGRYFVLEDGYEIDNPD